MRCGPQSEHLVHYPTVYIPRFAGDGRVVTIGVDPFRHIAVQSELLVHVICAVYGIIQVSSECPR